MQLNLGKPVAALRSASVARVTAAAAAAQNAHVAAGGYVYEHAGRRSTPAAVASLAFHDGVQDARVEAMQQINAAPHGSALAQIEAAFAAKIAALPGYFVANQKNT